MTLHSVFNPIAYPARKPCTLGRAHARNREAQRKCREKQKAQMRSSAERIAQLEAQTRELAKDKVTEVTDKCHFPHLGQGSDRRQILTWQTAACVSSQRKRLVNAVNFTDLVQNMA